MSIRPETPSDHKQIYEIHHQAFKRHAEPKLVDALRAEGAFGSDMSLVAEIDRRIVGHVLFSHLKVTSPTLLLRAAALAPISVSPNYQRKGIGTALIHNGLARLRKQGFQLVIVLGDPKYYSRFGFSAELGRKIECPYSGNHLMALELQPSVLARIGKATAMYPSAFSVP